MTTTAKSARAILINEMLCYIVNRRGRIAEKFLKTIVSTFYNAELTALAKTVLVDSVDTLKLEKWPRPLNRRDSTDSGCKHKKEIEDIFAIFAYLDEHDLIDRLPHFVSADTDMIPSSNWTESDMIGIMNRFGSIDDQLSVITRKIDENFTTVRSEVGTLLTEVISAKNISTDLAKKYFSNPNFTCPPLSGPWSRDKTNSHNSRVGVLSAVGGGVGSSCASTEDSDDGGSKGVESRGSLGMKQKSPWALLEPRKRSH